MYCVRIQLLAPMKFVNVAIIVITASRWSSTSISKSECSQICKSTGTGIQMCVGRSRHAPWDILGVRSYYRIAIRARFPCPL